MTQPVEAKPVQTPEKSAVVVVVRSLEDYQWSTSGPNRLRDLMVDLFRKNRATTQRGVSCVVDIRVKRVGSMFVRALYELWRVVRADGGEIVCVNWPTAYVDQLAASGVAELEGFSLARTLDDAMKRLPPTPR